MQRSTESVYINIQWNIETLMYHNSGNKWITE